MGEAKRRGTRAERIEQANGSAKYPPNEWILRDYIERKGAKALNPQWVFWMLRMLYDARRQKRCFDAAFLKQHPESKHEPEMEFQDAG